MQRAQQRPSPSATMDPLLPGGFEHLFEYHKMCEEKTYKYQSTVVMKIPPNSDWQEKTDEETFDETKYPLWKFQKES